MSSQEKFFYFIGLLSVLSFVVLLLALIVHALKELIFDSKKKLELLNEEIEELLELLGDEENVQLATYAKKKLELIQDKINKINFGEF